MPDRTRSLLVVADSLVGGIGAAVLSHARLFAEHGWQVTLAAPDATAHSVEGVTSYDVAIPVGASRLAGMASAARDVRRLTRRLAPEVVHAHGLRSLAVVLVGGRRPFVTLHSSDPTPGSRTRAERVKDELRVVAPLLVPGAFSVVPLERGRWTTVLIPSPRLAALDGLVDDPPAPDPLFVFAARLAPPKRPDLFIDVMAALALRVPGACGIVLGDGPDRDSVEAHIRASGAPVQVLGQVHDMTHWYRQAWAVCLFSDSEGLPFVVQEAMWAGRAVVTTELRGVTWFAGGAARSVAGVAEAVEALVELCDPVEREARGRRARTRALEMMGDDGVYRTLVDAYVRGGLAASG